VLEKYRIGLLKIGKMFKDKNLVAPGSTVAMAHLAQQGLDFVKDNLMRLPDAK